MTDRGRVVDEPGAVLLTGREAHALRDWARAVIREAGMRESRDGESRDPHLFDAVQAIVTGANRWRRWRSTAVSGSAEVVDSEDVTQSVAETYSTREVAALMELTDRGVRHLADTDVLHPTKVGKSLRYDPDEVHDLIETRANGRTDG